MQALPQTARFLLVGVYAISILLAASSFFAPLPEGHRPFWLLGILLALSALTFGRKIILLQPKTAEETDSFHIQVGVVLTFSAMLAFGPSGAVLVGFVGSLAGGLYPKRQLAYQLFFNVGVAVIEAWCIGQVFLAANSFSLKFHLPQSALAVAAASLVYFIVNTGLVAAIIALCQGERITDVWRQNFLWLAPSYFIAALVSSLAVYLAGPNLWTWGLIILPIVYLTYQSFAFYFRQAQENQQNRENLAELYLSTIKSLALAIDAKDQYTHQHILRVQRYAVATARQMGVRGDELEGLTTGALLHDIGKIGVKEYVLLKPGRLTEEEFAEIKRHPEIGAAILNPVKFPWPVIPVVKSHHEKWDGTGYPEGLKGEDIPLTARILCIADVYDALTSNRSYRAAMTHEKALAIIRKDIGVYFDPRVAVAFLEVIEGVVAEMAAEKSELAALTPCEDQPVSRTEQAHQDIQRTSSEVWALHEVAQTLSAGLGLQETLEILGRKLEAILPGATCLFLLRDRPENNLIVRAVVGVNREFFLGAHTLNESSPSAQVALTQETYRGEFNSDDLLMVGSPTAQWQPLHTSLIAPIIHQGDVLGVINLCHTQPNAFGPHDQQFLEMVAARAATAIYNGILNDRTRSQAWTDSLTSLANLRHLTESVDKATRHLDLQTETFALLCLDLDNFKPINDNFGHAAGDDVLRDLARLFVEHARQGDLVARYGGDEFVLVLWGAHRAEAEAMAQRLQSAVETYESGLSHARLGRIQLGVSIGTAVFPADGQDCATLLSAADAEMYRDKTERKLAQMTHAETSLASRSNGHQPDRLAA